MKKIAKNLVQKILVTLANVWLKRKKPKIIGITGSIGKTTIKEAVYSVLSSKFSTKKSEGNYNTEFGMPLSILGLKSGYSSPIAWFIIIVKAFLKAFFDSEKVEILILEMGIDKPGDMDDLLKIVTPDIGIFANVKPVHLAEGQFKDLDGIFDEKSKLIKAMSQLSVGILNIDDVRVKRLQDQAQCKISTFSAIDDAADFKAREIETTENGLQFFIHNEKARAKIQLPILGEYHVYGVLPAFACGKIFGMTLQEMSEAIKKFDLPKGRMNILAGINGSILIDSSYNASPDATHEALNVLRKAGERAYRRIAVLGNMNELGEYTEREHRRIGKKAPECCDMLIAVGEYTKALCEEARMNGLADNKIFWFKDSFGARDFLKDKIKNGDMILLKGSQNKVRLEIVVEKLMRDKERASELLVRQDKKWKNAL